MDGLDSRGQVVLIGATNRVDAIEGALRRPGRFDREFTFSLPGCEARTEILDIHTRKWKHPPTKELKEELAACCVGYCGADLKALCTEAAIRAFREKYPQVYTSDDKYAIDAGLVKVEKSHFVEAMSAITPAAHRGSVVQSRPLSPVVLPCLHRHLLKSMSLISDIFPTSAMSSELTKLSMLSFGSTIPFVYRPRLLLLGSEGVGLDHLGPAILHELEKFPIHSLGLPSLLSDPGAKTPEEALVHIFSEARITTPSVLHIPMFNNWWDNVHEMLSQMDPALLTYCDKIAAQGGPSQIPDDLSGSILGLAPVVQMGTVTRASARLQNVQPEINLDRDAVCTDLAADKSQDQDSGQEMPAPEVANSNTSAPSSAAVGDSSEDQSEPPRGETCAEDVSGDSSKDSANKLDGEISSRIECVLETLAKGLRDDDDNNPAHSILRFLLEFAHNQANF